MMDSFKVTLTHEELADVLDCLEVRRERMDRLYHPELAARLDRLWERLTDIFEERV